MDVIELCEKLKGKNITAGAVLLAVDFSQFDGG